MLDLTLDQDMERFRSFDGENPQVLGLSTAAPHRTGAKVVSTATQPHRGTQDRAREYRQASNVSYFHGQCWLKLRRA